MVFFPLGRVFFFQHTCHATTEPKGESLGGGRPSAWSVRRRGPSEAAAAAAVVVARAEDTGAAGRSSGGDDHLDVNAASVGETP